MSIDLVMTAISRKSKSLKYILGSATLYNEFKSSILSLTEFTKLDAKKWHLQFTLERKGYNKMDDTK